MTLPLEKNAICTLLTNKENYNGSSYFVNGLEDLNVPTQNYCIPCDSKSKDTYIQVIYQCFIKIDYLWI